MRKKTALSLYQKIDALFIALVGVILFWVIDAIAHFLFFPSYPDSFYKEFFHPQNEELYTRVLILILFSIFGILTQILLIQSRLRTRIDSLTQLPNITSIHDLLDQVVLKSEKEKRSFAVMTLEIKNTDVILNSVGRFYLDLIMRQVAKRFFLLPSTIYVGRVCEAKFLLILNDCDKMETIAFCEGELLEIFREPVKILNIEFTIEMKLGIDMFPRTSTAKDLIIRSEKALESGNKEDRYLTFYSEQLEAQAFLNFQILEGLPHAIKNDEFKLYLQSRNDLQSKKVLGFEILARWYHPNEGVILPGVFIPAYESTQGIHPFTHHFLEKALTSLLQLANASKLMFSFNFSTKTLIRSEQIEKINDIIDKSGFPRDQLIIEMTESFFMMSSEETREAVNILRNLGSKISIDDFGTGYSSISTLEYFNIDELKFDKSLIGNVWKNPRKQILIKATINFSHQLGIKVCAEGIESIEDLKWLTDNGCDCGQGYYFHKPEPWDKLRADKIFRQTIQ